MSTETVLINNLCGWDLYFKRATGMGNVKIPAGVKNYGLISYDEIQAQIQLRNVMFTGIDQLGGHARIQIVDDAQRKKLFGIADAESEAPAALTEESVKELLAIRTKAKFKERLEEMVKTDSEKKMLVEIAYRVGAEEASAWKVDALKALAETAGI